VSTVVIDYSRVAHTVILFESYLQKGEKQIMEWTQGGEQPFSVEDAWIGGWDFTVVFDDALVGGLDEDLDELLANLAAASGITEVIPEDREVFHLKVDDLDASAVEEKVAEALEGAGISYD
jgi:hypothetical protein